MIQLQDLDADRSGLSAADIPERLRLLVEKDRRAPVQQPGVEVQHDRWGKQLNEYAEVVRALPSSLDRAAVRDFALSRPYDPSGAIAAFIATQVWGYGTTGYGPFRLAEALAHPDLPVALHAARRYLRRGDPVGAFRVHRSQDSMDRYIDRSRC